MMDIRKYQDYRKEFLQDFEINYIPEKTITTNDSPCNGYSIHVQRFIHKEGGKKPAYTKAFIYKKKSGKLIFEIVRNFSDFWYTWCCHKNGSDYLLCGEDYHGYGVFNLTTGKKFIYYPDEGYHDMGFCWTAAYPSPDSSLLAVDGSYWASPYQLIIYDFSNPEKLPYKEIDIIDNLEEVLNWSHAGELDYIIEVEYRKSDGKELELLDEETITRLERMPGSIECKLEKKTFSMTREIKSL